MSVRLQSWSRLTQTDGLPGPASHCWQGRGRPGRRSTRARRLAAAARAIEADDARSANSLGFLPRVLIQATLPHSRARSHEFERVNGRFSLHMHAPPAVGLPYGSYPRLVLAWLGTQAVRTRSRVIRLGPSLATFMNQLGLTPITGRRGTKLRLANQLHRLFSTTVRTTVVSEDDPAHTSGIGYSLAHRHDLWWRPHDPGQHPSWSSSVTLGTDFFDEILSHPVPVDFRALGALRGSPLALDIYAWLTYRMSYLRKPCLIPWESLQTQFGADYGRLRDFQRKFRFHLAAVLHVYPAARLAEHAAGLLLRPSPTHLPRRQA